ncbi:MAG: hypothetical protein IJI46_06700 [Erysipelotrichaceae bacterium]|nr:hypothetical protein [Erysipelotrichaceae bacterium]
MIKKVLLILTILLLICSCKDNKKVEIDNTDDNYRVFYEIFVGSFSDSNNDGIGDLRGIINRLDYMNDGNINSSDSLGIQGIWLTPIFYSPSYHKYDVVDYYRIDPSFGTQEDLDELIQKCHERNILVILDLAINHTSSQNEWFKQFNLAHQNNDRNNKYFDYYTYVNSNDSFSGSFCDLEYTDQKYECNFSYDMPELNFDNENVRNEVLNIAKYYLDKGVDGFRFDAAKYIYLTDGEASVDFWKWYTEKLREIKEDIYLVGEVWSGEGEIARYQTEMDCFDFKASQADGIIAKTAKSQDINAFTSYVVNYQQSLASISKERMPIFFISNHDMDRSAGYLNAANGQAYMGANLYLLSPGSPFIYYGEEIGMKGSRGGSNTDANRRLAMLWGDDDTVKNPEGSTYELKNQINGTIKDQLKDNNSLLKHYSKLIMIRKKYPQIARGEYTMLDLGQADLGGFKIAYEEETTYIVHNNSDHEITIRSDNFTQMLESCGFSSASFKNNELKIGPYTSAILK